MTQTPELSLQGIIFDKDGTLFEFAATWEAWAQAFLLRMTNDDRAKAHEFGALIGFDMDSRSFARDSVVIAGTPGEVADALAPCFPGRSQAQILDTLNEEAAMAPQVEAVALPVTATLGGVTTAEGRRACRGAWSSPRAGQCLWTRVRG